VEKNQHDRLNYGWYFAKTFTGFGKARSGQEGLISTIMRCGKSNMKMVGNFAVSASINA